MRISLYSFTMQLMFKGDPLISIRASFLNVKLYDVYMRHEMTYGNVNAVLRGISVIQRKDDFLFAGGKQPLKKPRLALTHWKCDKGWPYFALYQQSSINISIVICVQTPYSLCWNRRWKLGMLKSPRWPLDTVTLLKGDLLQNKYALKIFSWVNARNSGQRW